MLIQAHGQSFLIKNGKKYECLSMEYHGIWWCEYLNINCEVTIKGRFSLHFGYYTEEVEISEKFPDGEKTFPIGKVKFIPIGKNASMRLNGEWVKGEKIEGTERDNVHPYGIVSSLRGTWKIIPTKIKKCDKDTCSICEILHFEKKKEREENQIPCILPATSKYWQNVPTPLRGREHIIVTK